MPTNSSRTPGAIRSGRVAPVNDFSSARVKLTLVGCPKRTVLSLREAPKLCELATGGILSTRYVRLKPAAVRACMRDPGRSPSQAGARHRTTTEDTGAMPIAITDPSNPGLIGRERDLTVPDRAGRPDHRRAA